jgi:hypothetical protein
MRVARPAWLNIKSIIFIVLILAIGGGYLGYRIHKNKSAQNSTVAQTNINLFKNLNNPGDMRVLAASYEQNQDYGKAEDTWKKVTQQTKDINDYWSLLNVCANYKVSDKESCVQDAAAALQKKVSSLDFTTAYSIGATLESNGFKKLSVPFYQQALAVYKPQSGGTSFPSQQQIQAKINELSK